MIFFFSLKDISSLWIASQPACNCHLKIASENCRLLLARLALTPPPSSISNFHLHPSPCVLLTIPEHRAGAHPADDNWFSCRTISGLDDEFPPERP